MADVSNRMIHSLIIMPLMVSSWPLSVSSGDEARRSAIKPARAGKPGPVSEAEAVRVRQGGGRITADRIIGTVLFAPCSG